MPDSDITARLLAWSNGEEAASGELLDVVDSHLRRLARGYLQRELRGGGGL